MASSDFRARFGENLARARKRSGMSQEVVAWRASLHRTEIGLLERGERLPRIDTVVKLAGALSIPPNQLLDGMAWSPGSTQLGEFTIANHEQSPDHEALTPSH